MKRISITKVAKDLYIEQIKWSVGFICIIMAVYIGLNILSTYVGFSFQSNIIMFTGASSTIYMFVIGIIAGATFLPQFIKLGVSRKICIYGIALAALFVSLTLPIIFSLFSFVESLFTGDFRLNLAYFILYVFNIYVGYLLGWLINIGYYRFHWIIGLVFIAFAVILNYIYSMIWGSNNFSLYEFDIISFDASEVLEAAGQFSSSSFLTSSLVTLIIITFILLIIRLLTKNMPIKIK